MKKLKKILLITLGVLTLLCASFLALIYIQSPKFGPVAYEPVAPDTWPTDGFQISTPEEQGMDSEKLLEMLAYYEKKSAEDPEFDIDSITIVRNGYIVTDLYFDPLYPEDTPHIIHSCTKSVMSALIGIAIEQGYIENVDVPVVEFFSDKYIQNIDPGMAAVTLWDLLTMQTGIHSQDSYLYEYQGLFTAQRSDDWVAYTLGLPMDVEPGTRFDYSNLSSFLLSAIIHETTGMDTLSYARENLFGPLGIEDVRWETSPQGIGVGWARIWLKPHDMAKFGMLYLQKGQGKGQQVIPEFPPMAVGISGITYLLEENNWNYDNFRLIFEPDANYATFSYTTKESDVVSSHVGLDNVYRFTETDVGTFAAVGAWISPDIFEINYQ